ncbi:MAG: hypothetical protein NC311_13965, partial [Muribaculaceae bacterium]|nr:hypothetical protein [Muribaculaceae bacterium]
VQFATKYKFLLSSDTLRYFGFENRATLFILDSPVSAVDMQLKDGDVFVDNWSGSVFTHGRNVLKRVRGVSRTSIEKGWSLTDGTDTIRDATLARWTLDMAYIDSTAITRDTSDSIPPETVSDLIVPVERMMTERLLTERLIWHCGEARYPVLVQTTTSSIRTSGEVCDTIPMQTMAMYYPPHRQQSDTGEQMAMKKKSDKGGGDNPAPYGEATDFEASEPKASENAIDITLSSAEGNIELELTMFTDSGIMLAEPVRISAGPVPTRLTLNIPGDHRGVVLIHIKSDRGQTTRKVII